jgi:MoxR-like ATPase
MTLEQIFAARNEVLNLHLAEPLEHYLIQLIQATRNPSAYGEDLARWVQYGGSPRATIGLDRSARAHAWLAGRDFVSPEDIQIMAPDVLRHRLILNYEAEADGVTTDQVINALLERVAVP